jgi:hypothetical protein
MEACVSWTWAGLLLLLLLLELASWPHGVC